MSLRWNRAVRLQLDPRGVSGSVWQGLWRKVPVARARRLIEVDEELGAPIGDAWLAAAKVAMEQVLDELAGTARLKRALLQVQLSDALVVLDVAVGEFAGHSDRQLQAIAEACSSELLGAAQARPEVRWQLQRDERHLLICALSQRVFALLTEAATHHGMPLASVQPYFLRQWNLHARTLQPGHAVFAVASGVNAVIACVREGVITTLSSGPWLKPPSANGAKGGRVEQLISELHLEPAGPGPALLDVRVDRLLASIGQDAAAQSAFVLVGSWLKQRRAHNIVASGSDPLAAPPATDAPASVLDARVDRLLASRGDDASAQSAFVLVSNRPPPGMASKRWTLLSAERGMA